jgi:hypothetical protein
MSGEAALEDFDNLRFGFLIGFGDQVDRVALAGDAGAAEPFEMDAAGGARRSHRDLFDFRDLSHGLGNYASALAHASARRQDIHRSLAEPQPQRW